MPKKPTAERKASQPKAASKQAKTKQAAQANGRQVVHDTFIAQVCTGAAALTVDQVKELLGWQEETEQNKFGSDYLLRDGNGVKVRCTNNVTNRPLYMSNAAALMQEHLRRRWYLNGEPIIIGRTGLVLNGQHQMIGLVLAAQEIAKAPDKWAEYWQGEPTMEKLVVYGVDEADTVVNTMDTCKPRSLADVIYRSEYFASKPANERRMASKMTEAAVRLLWLRTGANLDAFSLRRTHSESVDFINRHPRLLECVAHIMEENGSDARIQKYVRPGSAAAMLYLMGSSTTDAEAYQQSSSPNETMLDWANWDKACEFWVLLASGAKDLQAVRNIYATMQKEGVVSADEQMAVLTKAWACFSSGDTITDDDVLVEYGHDADGNKVQAEFPILGGIDIGDPKDADEARIARKDPTPEEIEERSAQVRAARTTKAKAVTPDRGKRSGDKWAKGDTAWIYDHDGKHYFGTLTDDPYEVEGTNRQKVMVQAADGEWEVDVANLRLERPVAQPTQRQQKQATADAQAKSVVSPAKAKAPQQAKPQQAKGKQPTSVQVPKVGTVYWVVDPDGDHWRGRVVEVNPAAKVARLTIEQGFKGAGNTEVVAMAAIRTTQPKPQDTP